MYGKFSSFQDPLSRPLIQSITNRVRKLNSKYYLPTNEQTKIVSEPVRALRDQLQEVSSGSTTSIQVQPYLHGAR